MKKQSPCCGAGRCPCCACCVCVCTKDLRKALSPEARKLLLEALA